MLWLNWPLASIASSIDSLASLNDFISVLFIKLFLPFGVINGSTHFQTIPARCAIFNHDQSPSLFRVFNANALRLFILEPCWRDSVTSRESLARNPPAIALDQSKLRSYGIVRCLAYGLAFTYAATVTKRFFAPANKIQRTNYHLRTRPVLQIFTVF